MVITYNLIKRSKVLVKLDGRLEGDNVVISQQSFNYLLACLANQKYVGELPINGDSIADGKESYDATQREIQESIDNFYHQCMDLLISDNPL